MRGARLLFTLVLLLAPATLSAGTTVSASVDRDTITVGDPITLSIRASSPAAETPALPSFAGGTIGPFEILEKLPTLEETKDGVRTTTLDLRITAFRTGDWEVPAIAPETGGEGSAPLRIVVRSVGLDPSGSIRDVKRPIAIPRNWFLTLLPMAALLLLGAAAFFLIRRMRRRKIPAPVLGPADLRPAHVLALEALRELENEKGTESVVPRTFYFRLSSVLRDYLDNRYALPAPERTTREILRELRRESIDPEATGLLRELFSRCDLVKFRGVEVTRPDADEALSGARTFVEKTREHGAEREGAA